MAYFITFKHGPKHSLTETEVARYILGACGGGLTEEQTAKAIEAWYALEDGKPFEGTVKGISFTITKEG
jgi:hypothetical protein